MNCTASSFSLYNLYYFFFFSFPFYSTSSSAAHPSVLKAFLGPTTFRTRPGVVEFVRDTVAAVDISSGSWAVRSVVPARPDQRSLFAKISSPVLVVAGAEDATFPVPETLAMADAIPNSAVAVLDGVAHLAGLENPPLVNKLIDDFVFRE